ncbi:ion transporter [Streptococcus mutans]|uniref:ion transporter n=1 Tax=Streptococcus mutans TaxID=1309 RepID=UPI001CFE0264|nr:ion transporter [Streptococcus mutans]MCB4974344.1 ion transporter [Streptococcus mutans]MCB4999317.1 ion transporter [Streptococcus mutans]MCB5021747.1 ion transporter [Streptococcus mutans]MDT9564803.1 ion transporter [Streptococcus mutans]MDT9577003.1 ion transporter [Streptococcus mutans]
MRQTIYEIIDSKDNDSTVGKCYNAFMILTISFSLLPLTVKTDSEWKYNIDNITSLLFLIDYLLRFCTADFHLNKGKLSFLYYPFTPLAIIDLLCLSPSVLLWNNSLKLLKIIRFTRMLRLFKIIRHSKNITIILNVLKKQKDSLVIVGIFSLGYIFLSALIIFNVEPNTFPNFFDAIYWATISLTTVGYGDIFAVSTIGKIITMFSSLIGVAIVALPAGIITAGYMEEIQNHKK